MSALDVISFDEAAGYLGGVAHDNEMLTLFIAGVSAKLDDLCGPIVKRTLTEVHDGGARSICLDEYPVDSITTLSEYIDGAAVDVDSADYLASTNGLVYRLSNGSICDFAPGKSNVAVSYVAGRFNTTADVDPIYRLAAMITVRHLWKSDVSSASDFGAPLTFAIPNAAAELLGDNVQINLTAGIKR